jgi:Icc-related predicted phosphoesterase
METDVRLVCISDTHSQHHRLGTLPEGDVLVHAGDVSRRGGEAEIRAFAEWFASQPHRHKIMVAGNHDFAFEQEPGARTWIEGATYLQDEGCEVGGVSFWGSPYQPWFYDWAFQRQRGSEMAEIWERIPVGVDVLITHGPPHGILDRTARGAHAGCEALLEAVWRVSPRIHVFGHIHEEYGQLEQNGIRFVNASTCSVTYDEIRPPIVLEL